MTQPLRNPVMRLSKDIIIDINSVKRSPLKINIDNNINKSPILRHLEINYKNLNDNTNNITPVNRSPIITPKTRSPIRKQNKIIKNSIFKAKEQQLTNSIKKSIQIANSYYLSLNIKQNIQTNRNKLLIVLCLGLAIYVVKKNFTNENRLIIIYGALIVLGILLGYLMTLINKIKISQSEQMVKNCYEEIKHELMSRLSNGEINPIINKYKFINNFCEKNKISASKIKTLSKQVTILALNDKDIIERVMYIDSEFSTILKLNNIIIT